MKITIDGKLSAAAIKRKAAAAEVLYGPLQEIKIYGDFPTKDGDCVFLSAPKQVVKAGQKYITILVAGQEVSFDPTEGMGTVQYIEIRVYYQGG